MRRLMNWIRQRREAAQERRRMARVEAELQIKRELDYVESQRPAAATKQVTMSQLTAPSLMSQSINDLNRRC